MTSKINTIDIEIAKGNASDNDNASSWQYSLDGGTSWITGGDNQQVTLADGRYELQIRQIDNVGNISEVKSQQIVIETQAPAVPSLQWTEDTGTAGDNITHNGVLQVGGH